MYEASTGSLSTEHFFQLLLLRLEWSDGTKQIA